MRAELEGCIWQRNLLLVAGYWRELGRAIDSDSDGVRYSTPCVAVVSHRRGPDYHPDGLLVGEELPSPCFRRR